MAVFDQKKNWIPIFAAWQFGINFSVFSSGQVPNFCRDTFAKRTAENHCFTIIRNWRVIFPRIYQISNFWPTRVIVFCYSGHSIGSVSTTFIRDLRTAIAERAGWFLDPGRLLCKKIMKFQLSNSPIFLYGMDNWVQMTIFDFQGPWTLWQYMMKDQLHFQQSLVDLEMTLGWKFRRDRTMLIRLLPQFFHQIWEKNNNCIHFWQFYAIEVCRNDFLTCGRFYQWQHHRSKIEFSRLKIDMSCRHHNGSKNWENRFFLACSHRID